MAFLMLDHIQEVFFGGAAGGGKSDALLMAALQYVDVPHYNAVLFRRSYADLSLPGALLDRAREWLGETDAHYNDREHTWNFPKVRPCDIHDGKDGRAGSGCEAGGSLTFGYLQTDRQKYRYQSADFQFIGFDELTQFSESMYTYLFSRLRKERSLKVPLRMRAGSNPGGFGHEWVKTRFITPATRRPDAVFVPSKIDDNPSLDREEYLTALAQLDPITRARMLAGDWDIQDEGMFKARWFNWADVRPAGARVRWVRYWDLAATPATPDSDPDWTAGALVAIDVSTAQWWIADIVRDRLNSNGVERLVHATAERDGRAVPVMIEQEPGAAGKSLINYYARYVLPGWNVRGSRPVHDKPTRAGPVASQAEAGNLYMVRAQWNSSFIDEAEGFPYGQHDDQIDAVSGGFAVLTQGGEAQSRTYITMPGPAVVRRGDLVLRGQRYIDKA
jgi:predicted phage terminase large subunit-like protein